MTLTKKHNAPEDKSGKGEDCTKSTAQSSSNASILKNNNNNIQAP